MSSTGARCPFCHADAEKAFRARDYNRRLSPEYFQYHHCGECGLFFLHPIPPDLGRYYPRDYYVIPDSAEQLEAALAGVRFKMEILKRFKQSGDLLEIGPACGDFALQAKQAGFKVEVIEMDPRCCEFLEKKVGIRAICTSDTFGALHQAGPYDVIALWHVIEHLTNVPEMIGAIAARLKPGGVALLAAPNPESFQFGVLGGRWTHVDAPRHVVLIPLDKLKAEAEKHGLHEEWRTTNDEGSLGWNVFGWEQSLGNLADGRRSVKLLRKLGRSVSKWAQSRDWREGRGSTYTAVYRRNGGAS